MSGEKREEEKPPGGAARTPVPAGYDQTVVAGKASPPPSAAIAPSGAVAETAPQRLGGYRLLKKLASGGMGAIYLALQESVGRQVAIKVLPESAFHDPDAVARFQREIQVLGQLKHPGICPVLDSGLDGQTHFYVMDYIRGMDLARVLGTQRMDPRRAAVIAAQVAQALHSAHQAGVVHRDIKPLNIMLTRGEKPRDARGDQADSTSFGGAIKRFFSWASISGPRGEAIPVSVAPSAAESPAEAGMPSPEWRDRAVLIDFGLARDGAAATHLTASGALMGTPSYMAPEQARGERKAIGPATDVYGLGATLYEMLTLRPPFLGESMGEVLAKVTNEEPAPVRKLNPLVDRDLETIVQKAMEKEPERRYADAAGMAQDLDAWLAGEAIQARRASLGYRVKKRVFRNKLASGAIAAAVVLAAVGAWATLSPGELVLQGFVLEGAKVLVDGKPVTTSVLRLWPGQHDVKVTREGYVDFSQDIDVPSRKRVSMDVAMISRFGAITVLTEPPGAEVSDQDGILGITPLSKVRILAGERFLEFHLRDHESDSVRILIRPGDTASEITRQLRHETGTLTLTSDPPELGIDLVPEGTKRKIIAAAPAEKFALPTGRYEVTAHARNHFPRVFTLEIRAGEEVKRNITLTSLFRWRTTADLVAEGVITGDITGDGRPDVVVASKTPARIRAVDGRSGELLWVTRKPPLTASYGLPLNLSDLDGELEPELVYAAGDRLVALDGRTGVEKAAWDFPGLRDAVDWGDLDGDGITDFVAHTRSALLAIRGVDSKTLWSLAVASVPIYGRGDLDGDGRPDVAAGGTGRGMVGIEGRTGKVLWRREDFNGGGPVVCVDVNGDGHEDVLAVSQTAGPTALSGKDGSTLWTVPLDNYDMIIPPLVADLEGDGKMEAVFCRGPLLEVREAATGKIINVHEIGPGSTPAVVDVDGDGHKDLILNGAGTVIALDGLTGKMAFQFDSNTAASMSAPILDDFDGDGLQDFILLSNDGSIAVVNAVEPPVLWRQFSAHMHTAEPEVLGDPAEFVFLGGFPQSLLDPRDGRVLTEIRLPLCKLTAVSSGTRPFRIALDGQDRVLLEVAENPVQLKVVWSQKDQAVLSSPTLADLNGDGVPDVLTGDGEGGPGVRASDGTSGLLLWNAPLARPWRGDIASWAGLVWVPSENALHGLDPETGKEKKVLDLGGRAAGAVAFDGDLLGFNFGGRVIRFHASGNRFEEAWRKDLGIVTGPRALAAQGPLVVAWGGRGHAVALDGKTGEERWRQVLEQAGGGGPGLRDLDGDGFPEVAVSSFDVGWMWVLDGKSGEILWAWRTGVTNAWSRPTWADLDGDGAPELLSCFRDGRAYAFKVKTRRPAPVAVLRPDGNPWHAAADSAAELRRRAAVFARTSGRWRDILDLAAGTRDPFLAAEAAKAAGRLGDAGAARTYASLARDLHVRRLDVDLAGCLADAPEARVGSMKRALLAAPAHQIPAASAPKGAEADWRPALEAAVAEAQAGDDWERAVALHGLLRDYPSALAAFERASRGRAPDSRLRLALGRAASAADEFTAAREQFRAVLADPVLAATAQFEIDGLIRLGEQLRSELRAAFASGRYEAGAAAGERFVKLRPADSDAWNEFAWDVATSASPPPALARRALEAARRAVQILDEQGAGPGEERGGILDTLAAALFAAGEFEEAVHVQREAVGMMSNGPGRSDLELRLKKYEKALKSE